MHTGSATSLCYGLPAVHVLSSNFGEFPQNHSRETYQIPDMVWLPRAAGTDHIPRSCLYTLVEESKKPVQLQCPRILLHQNRAALAGGHGGPCLVGPRVLGTLWTCGCTSSHHTERKVSSGRTQAICLGSSEPPIISVNPYTLLTP